MFIRVSRTSSGRYVFAVGDDPSDDVHLAIHSARDAALLGDVPPTFSSFGEAHAFASRVADDRPSSVLARKVSGMQNVTTDSSRDDLRGIAEGEVVAHYSEQVDIVEERARAALGASSPDSDELEAISKEMEGVGGEIARLSEIASEDGKKAFDELRRRLDAAAASVGKSLPSRQAMGVPGRRLAKAAVRAFSEAAMAAVRPLHEDVFVRGASATSRGYDSFLSTPKGDVVRLSFDRHLLLSGVYPCGRSLAECGGMHPESFLVRYWEPIVDAVGHFRSMGQRAVAVAGADRRRRDRMAAFGMDDNATASILIDRRVVMGRRTWALRREAATVTSPPDAGLSVDDEVECVDRSLPTYAGRTGSVVAVNEKPSMTLLRVDFRRGLGPVWLSSDSVRRVNIGA